MRMMAVITSINKPTHAVEKLASQKIQTVVVADQKTPLEWQVNNVRMLSVQEQESLNYPIVKKLPWNHYSRKMLGYIYAIKQGSEVIYDTDDDNIIKENWCCPEFLGTYSMTKKDLDFINIYQCFTHKDLWPRGFPLNLILNNYRKVLQETNEEKVYVGIWQGLADGDPDVDAVYRLTSNESCIFERQPPIVLNKGTICPFNSQNTFFHREAFPLLYIPTTVTFRFCDILRGLVAQPILWAKGLHLGFTEATVYQQRNPHNYLKDFESEIPMYLHCDKIVSSIAGAIRSSLSVEDNLLVAYEKLAELRVVHTDEMGMLVDWLSSI